MCEEEWRMKLERHTDSFSNVGNILVLRLSGGFPRIHTYICICIVCMYVKYRVIPLLLKTERKITNMRTGASNLNKK